MNNVAWSEHLANLNARTPEDIPLEYFDPRISDPAERIEKARRAFEVAKAAPVRATAEQIDAGLQAQARHRDEPSAVEVKDIVEAAFNADKLHHLVKEWVMERKTILSGENAKMHEIARRLAAAVGEELA
ncbi:hypothetical protein [Rhizobium sp. BK176]|uniref:hypothetical protein n=1 Tax=Rhizobium sp. BK176 TaxID=2587071 RepID=UPI002169939B|nr:hypothetical protein [Rhizobium sp. BK176]MCS4088965.1 ABC-type phosphate transport system ATPase subunit [Rhizobium sp. BK176]